MGKKKESKKAKPAAKHGQNGKKRNKGRYNVVGDSQIFIGSLSS